MAKTHEEFVENTLACIVGLIAGWIGNPGADLLRKGCLADLEELRESTRKYLKKMEGKL